MDEVALRDAVSEDVDGLVDLETSCFDASYLGQDLSRDEFLDRIASPSAVLIVAEAGTRLLGYALLMLDRSRHRAALDSVAVARDFRGRGLGARLCGALEARARHEGFAAIELEVRTDNGRAIALYERLGYERAECLPAFYADGVSALKMIRRLDRMNPHTARDLQEVPRHD